MKFEVTLTTDEYAALSKVPGRSAQQRIRWIVKFWQAVVEEKAKSEKPKLELVQDNGSSIAVEQNVSVEEAIR